MANKMLIDASHPEETRVVVVRGDRVEEFDFESSNHKQLRGNIYLAKVTRVEPSLQAAFIEYGGNRHGFLAFSEIHPDYYQIPVADREALLEEEAAEQAAERQREQDEGEDGDNGGSSGRRSRRRRSSRAKRRRDDFVADPGDTDETVEQAAETSAGDDGSASTDAVSLENADGDVSKTQEVADQEIQPDLETGAQGEVEAAIETAQQTILEPGAPTNGTLEVQNPSEPGEAKDAADPATEQNGTITEASATSDTDQTATAMEATASDAEELAATEATPVEAPLADSNRESSEEVGATDVPVDAPEGDQPDNAAADTEPQELSDQAAESDSNEADGVVQADAGDGNENELADTEDADTPDAADLKESRRDDDETSEDEDDSDDEESEDDDVEDVGAEDALEEVPDRPRRPRRTYKIQEVIKRRQILLVQVVKEERGNKGAALTTYLSLAGRYSVLMPNTARGGGISRKITNTTDRKRLKTVASELSVPEGMGVILRTAGASRTKAEIKRDFEYLLRLWENVRELTLESVAPTLVYEEGSLVKRSIRDLYNKDIDQVSVAGENAYREAKDFMRMLMPSHAKNVQPYRDSVPLFSRFGIEAQLDAMFSPQVTLKSGGYIIINQTEALVAIDVNSGRSTREHNIEDTALQTNLEAATEVARQLRLRDLAGLIVIDFIDMEENRNNRAVERKVKDVLKSDRARIQVGRISHFGLLEMSRQRLRTGVLEGSTEQCPMCHGAGRVRSVESVALHVLRAIEAYLMKSSSHNISVRTRSEVALYMLNAKRHTLTDYERRFGLEIEIVASHDLGSEYYALDRGEVASAKPQIEATAVDVTSVHPDIGEVEDDGAGAEREDDETAEMSDGEQTGRRRRRRRRRGGRRGEGERDEVEAGADASSEGADDPEGGDDEVASAADGEESDDEARARKRRRRGRRGGRRNRRGREEGDSEAQDAAADADETSAEDDNSDEGLDGGDQADPSGDQPVSSEPSGDVDEEKVAAAPPGSDEITTSDVETDPEPRGAEEEDVSAKPLDVGAAEVPETSPEPVAAETPETSTTESQSDAGEPDQAMAEATPEQPPESEQSRAPEPASTPEPQPEEPPKPKRRGWWQRRGLF